MDNLIAVAGKYYRMLFLDTGNDESDPLFERISSRTDQQVVATSTRKDRAEGGVLLLESLSEQDERSARLAREAVVVISVADRSATNADIREITEGFAPLCRKVVTYPPRRSVIDGWLKHDALGPATRRACLAAAPPWLKASEKHGNEGAFMSEVEDLSKLREAGYAFQSKELVDKYSPEALLLMERLWQDVASFHAPRYFLPEDSPLPSWLMDVFRDVPNQGVEGGRPQFARYWNPIDWPALIAEHPGEIGWDQPEYPAMYAELRDWGHREGLNPWFDVGFWISPEAKIDVAVGSVSARDSQPG